MVAMLRMVECLLELRAGEVWAQATMKKPFLNAAFRDAAFAIEHVAFAGLAPWAVRLLLPFAYPTVCAAHADLLFVHSFILSTVITASVSRRRQRRMLFAPLLVHLFRRAFEESALHCSGIRPLRSCILDIIEIYFPTSCQQICEQVCLFVASRMFRIAHKLPEIICIVSGELNPYKVYSNHRLVEAHFKVCHHASQLEAVLGISRCRFATIRGKSRQPGSDFCPNQAFRFISGAKTGEARGTPPGRVPWPSLSLTSSAPPCSPSGANLSTLPPVRRTGIHFMLRAAVLLSLLRRLRTRSVRHASAPPVTQKHWLPATRPPGSYRGWTFTN